MTLWLMLALMTGTAMIAVEWPLLRKAGDLRAGSDIAVYRDQLHEIRRDQQLGWIGSSEAEAAQVEVSRRLLAAADAEPVLQHARVMAASRHRAVALLAPVVVSFGAALLYLSLGSPSLPEQPLASRNQHQSIEGLIAQVENHLARNPSDGSSWEVVAPIYLRLGRVDDAVKARRNGLALNGETSERQAGLGEALVAAGDGKVTPGARKAFERAVELDASNIKARYFLGVAAEQEGKPAAAVTMWRAILVGAPTDAPWAEFIRKEVTRLGGGTRPSEEEGVAATSDLTPDQRTAMIRGMVARLAEHLNRDGSDLVGWLRLVRSYMVLGDRDKARAAAGAARRALAGEPDKLRQIDDLAKGLRLEE